MTRRRGRRRKPTSPAPVEHSPELAAELEHLDALYPEGQLRIVLLPLCRAKAIHEHEHAAAPDDTCTHCDTVAYRAARGLQPHTAGPFDLGDAELADTEPEDPDLDSHALAV
jgi:hypothetical protein